MGKERETQSTPVCDSWDPLEDPLRHVRDESVGRQAAQDFTDPLRCILFFNHSSLKENALYAFDTVYSPKTIH